MLDALPVANLRIFGLEIGAEYAGLHNMRINALINTSAVCDDLCIMYVFVAR